MCVLALDPLYAGLESHLSLKKWACGSPTILATKEVGRYSTQEMNLKNPPNTKGSIRF